MPEVQKPDYTDMDWTYLIQDRSAGWLNMWEEYRREGLEPVALWQTGSPKIPRKKGFVPKLLLHPVQKQKRGTIIICAGGGFRFKSANEAKPVAEYFYNAGLNTAVLDYTVDKDAEPFSIESLPTIRACREDGLRAIRYLRYHAEQLGIRNDRIAIGGFSAGGFLSLYAATSYDDGDPNAADPIDRVSSRSDAVLPIYSAFRNADEITGSAKGRRYDFTQQRILSEFAADVNLRKDSPPFFLMQTAWDDPRGMMRLGIALANRGIPFEMHLFEEGPHGAALYDGKHPHSPLYAHTSHWAELACEWLSDKGF